MKFWALPLFFSILFVQGCEESNFVDATAKPVAVEAVSGFSKGSIDIDRGGALKFDGRIVRYDLIRNQRGVFDRYVIESAMSQMGLEGAIFAELAKKGYLRKVRQDQVDRYVVNYVSKGRVPLSAEFRPWEEHGAKSRLVITRRVEER
ncbi:hypothetical protein [Stutzerimonas chloritidismutans]